MLSKKAQSLKPSPTLAIAAKAKELQAAGHKVIGLSVGEPDWDTFAPIKRAGIAAIEKGQTKYSASNGTPELRERIAQMTSEELGVRYTAPQVTVTTGAKFVLFGALQMLCDSGDEVLIPIPYWVSYPTMAELVDGRPIVCDINELEARVTSRSKVLLLNSPNNPTGDILTRAQLEMVARVMDKNPRLIVISDDIYNRLIFNGEKVAPHLLHVAPHLKDRVIVVNGASKSLSMTGWRIGWALGPEPVIKAMTNYQSQTVSCVAPFTQTAALTGLRECQGEIDSSVQLLIRRRDFFVQGLNEIPGWKSSMPQGAFYVWADVRGLMGKKWKGQILHGSREVAETLLSSQMVAVVPGAESGVEGFLRLSFALGEADLKEALVRIRAYTSDLSD